MMVTMLTIFIPQACYDNNNQLKICSLNENYENTDIYHKITLYWNIITFFTFINTYYIELKRVNRCIKYLDIDKNSPDNNLKKIIDAEKKLDKDMDRLNKIYYYSILITILSYFINLALMINILINDYHSNSTISTFISFTLLVQIKLYNSYIIAKGSMKNDMMLSAYMNEFVSFNILDSDYLKNKLTNRP